MKTLIALALLLPLTASAWENVTTNVKNKLTSSAYSGAYSSGNGYSSSSTWMDGSVKAFALGDARRGYISGNRGVHINISGGSTKNGNAVSGIVGKGTGMSSVWSRAMIGKDMGKLDLSGSASVEVASHGNGYFHGRAGNKAMGSAHYIPGGDVKLLWTDGYSSMYTKGNGLGSAYQQNFNSIQVH